MRTELVLLGKLLAELLEVEHIHVEVVDQSAGKFKTELCLIILNSTVTSFLAFGHAVHAFTANEARMESWSCENRWLSSRRKFVCQM